MNCSEARKLALTQGLSEQQVRLLRTHARECETCRAEIEGALLARNLAGASLESPSPSFAHTVMQRIETARAPGRLSSEHVLAAVCSLVAVAGFPFLVAAVKRLVPGLISNSVLIQLSAKLLKGSGVAYVVDTCLTVVEGLCRAAYEPTITTYATGVIVGLALIVVLFRAKPREST